jgi:RHS repeat-associated core domain
LPHAYSLPTNTMTFDADNRLATFNSQNVTNDLDGNMTWGPGTNGSFVSYSYNARNWLLGAGGLSYGYDPAGNRTSLTNGTNVVRFVINPNAPLSQVLMRIKGGTTNYYIYGLGLLYEITETAASTNTLTYHFDLRGSTIAVTDPGGNIKEQFQYSTYGTITFRSASTDTPFLFNGRYGVQTDPNGLLFMRARYYNPFICRFANADPAQWSGGLNFYAFADGNPISKSDPFGLGAFSEKDNWSWLLPTSADAKDLGDAFKDIGNYFWQRCIFNPHLPPKPLVVVSRDRSQGFLSFMWRGMRYLDGNGNVVPQSADYIRVDASGRTVDVIEGVVPSFVGSPAGAGTKIIGIADAAAPKLLNPGINVTDKGMLHVLERHTVNGIPEFAGKSKFLTGVNLTKLIEEGTQMRMVRQANGNYARTFDVGRIIGFDRNTGLATSRVTIITRSNGDLVTMFPGSP